MTVSAPGAAQWSTLQVGNIPGETSRYQLEHFFSDIGPVKKCFTVKRKYKTKYFKGSACPTNSAKSFEREVFERADC